jgi:hypothetical protein
VLFWYIVFESCLSPVWFLSYTALPIYFSGNRTEHDKTEENYDRLRKWHNSLECLMMPMLDYSSENVTVVEKRVFCQYVSPTSELLL